MSAYSYATVPPVAFPQATTASPASRDAGSRPDRSAPGNQSVALYRATALSKLSPDEEAIIRWLEPQGTYISPDLEQAVAKVVASPATTRNAIELLQQWYATPSHRPEEYWDGLVAELAANRLTLRKSEG